MDTFMLRSNASPSAGRVLTKAVLAILRECLHDSEVLNNVDLLLTEAITNVTRHAYGKGDTGDVEVELVLNRKANVIDLQVSDWGCGFSGCDVALSKPELSAPDEEGGRGLFIISSLSDQCFLEEEEGKNTLHIRITTKEHTWVR